MEATLAERINVVREIPPYVLLDREGNLRQIFQGYLNIQLVDEVLGGSTSFEGELAKLADPSKPLDEAALTRLNQLERCIEFCGLKGQLVRTIKSLREANPPPVTAEFDDAMMYDVYQKRAKLLDEVADTIRVQTQ